MTQTISRTYSSRDNAAEAVKKLKSTGFADDLVNVVAPPDSNASDFQATETPDDELIASISRGGVVATHAPVYADGIRRGETLVSVRAPFGCAATVTSILEQFSPTETGLGDPGYEVQPRDPAAPLSSACGWRVLIDNPAPLSTWLGWRTLSTGRPSPKLDRDLVDKPAPLSKVVGMPVLSDKPAILSTRFGWRLLLDNPAPLSKRFGWPLLSRDQKPPQTRFGLPLRSDNPAPLSAALGLKLLSSNPAPLSKLFGWRVLSRDKSK